MQLRLMYVIIAVLLALVAALTGSVVTLVEGGRPTAAFRTGAITFAGSLTLLIVVMGALGVVGS
ncbi:hypothetical protein SSOG_04164 [Streptomyces himastatinicus ATCC 53653]|uniref:Uncharacterized protein n=1 Tax=Streptomyces himastatinicus ATCC 53653 TaxID=457427 RepID=D9WVU1_9ACTN|nr:hypothetical protein [Streptomyces himastatinicus]EFL24450.1 hypothetical protein SSOG_04164 [Streptomyces himastatinicus ATCC 53653]